MKTVLITGTNSGLGKSIFNSLTDTTVFSLNRKNRSIVLKSLVKEGVDTIVHAAFSGQGGYEQFNIEDYFKYVDDNILLTKELLDIPHKRFIYISSLVVYETNINNYKTTKLYCEAMVNKLGNNPLILRCPAILNQNMRKNNLIKIIEDDYPKISLTPNSTFNYITDKDIVKVINNNQIKGTLDFVASNNIQLNEIVDIIGKKVTYGDYTFTTPKVSLPYLNKTSKQVLVEFLKKRKK